MSKEQGKDNVKRFFIQGTPELHKQLQHLAIDFNTSAEKLAGKLLALAVELAKSGKVKPADLK